MGSGVGGPRTHTQCPAGSWGSRGDAHKTDQGAILVIFQRPLCKAGNEALFWEIQGSKGPRAGRAGCRESAERKVGDRKSSCVWKGGRQLGEERRKQSMHSRASAAFLRRHPLGILTVPPLSTTAISVGWYTLLRNGALGLLPKLPLRNPAVRRAGGGGDGRQGAERGEKKQKGQDFVFLAGINTRL